MFGSKSEKHLKLDADSLQPSLFDQECNIGPEEQARLAKLMAEEEKELENLIVIKEHERKVRKPIDTSKLEVREEHLYPQSIKGKELDYTEMPPEISDYLEMIPAQVYIRRVVRHRFVLKSNLQIETPERQAFEIPALPAAPINKCMAGASVLTDIMMQKFLYHLPFYRVIRKYKESGVEISDSKMNDWFAATCSKLKPIYDKLKEEVLKSDHIQVDESTLPVIDNEKHRAVKGYIWCVRDAINGGVFFRYYNGSRSKDAARTLLDSYRGTIQTYAYPVYEEFEGKAGKQMIGCWAHARRRFVESLEENRKLASEAIVYISGLYAIEKEMKEAGLTEDQIRERRRAESLPIIQKLVDWIEAKYPSTLNKDNILIRGAMEYTYKIIPKLSRYVNDGRLNIDNNLCEGAIRPLAIGRKNYMFCGNDTAACRAALTYSLISSCKAAGVDPKVWMKDVLCRLPYVQKGEEQVENLLPANWKPLAK